MGTIPTWRVIIRIKGGVHERTVEEFANDEAQARRKAQDHYPGFVVVDVERVPE